MINLHTKFEVSMFTHYEGMKGNANVEFRVVWGGVVGDPRSLAMSPFDSAYDFLFDFNRNYASVLYHFRVMAIYLSKVAYINLPYLHLTPLLVITPFEFCRDLWCPWAIVWHCLHDSNSVFGCFDTIPAFGGQADTH